MNDFCLIKYKNTTQSSKATMSGECQKKNNETSLDDEDEEGELLKGKYKPFRSDVRLI